jgi:hypothetical protein
MFTLSRCIPLRSLFLEQFPTLSAAMLIAELFYKFHSFFLECLAFLATWFVIDWLWQLLAGAILAKRHHVSRPKADLGT